MIRKKIDCHIHTNFSPDGHASAEDIVLAALEMQLMHIAFTDHMDIRYKSSEKNMEGVTDLDSYKNTIMTLKDKYKDKIYIAQGLECGWASYNEGENYSKLSKTPMEYVINSIHEVNGSDPYYESHFAKKTKHEAYMDYFLSVYKSLEVGYDFDTIGHLGYIERTAPYSDTKIYLSDFSQIIDEILKKIIHMDKILELNASVYALNNPCIPDPDILHRFKALGGKYITFSSDTHHIRDLCRNYEKVALIALSCGFDCYTIKQNGDYIQVKIED